MFRPTDRLRLFASLLVSLDIDINISPKSSSNTKLLISRCLFIFLTRVPVSSVFCHYVDNQLFFCYLAKVSYFERFSALQKLFGCDLTTHARLRNFSAPQIQKKALVFINSVFLSKETAVLIQSTVLYLPSDCKHAEKLKNARRA